jgi:hypothetical protein
MEDDKFMPKFMQNKHGVMRINSAARHAATRLERARMAKNGGVGRETAHCGRPRALWQAALHGLRVSQFRP